MNQDRLQGLRVLLVEDEYLIAKTLKVYLEGLGAEVIGPAATLRDGMTYLQESEALDAVIMDINLRGEKCFPLADAAQARGVCCVLTTGYDQSALPAAYSALPLLLKPFPYNAVSSALKKLCRVS